MGSAGASPSGPGGSTRGGRKRTKCSPAGAASGLQGILRVLRQVAREDGRLLAPVEHLALDALARHRHADDARKHLAADFRFGFVGCPQGGEGLHADLGSGRARAAHGALGDEAQDRFEAVVARGMDVVGLGRGEQELVDAPADERAEPRGAPDAEHAQHAVERVLQVGDGLAPLVHGAEHVDEHDLAIEPAEMVAKERPHDVRLIALEAPRHHGGERAARDRAPLFERQRAEGEQRRAFEIARHQEAAGTRRVQHMVLGPRRLEVVGKEARALECNLLVLAGIRIDRAQEFEPRLGGAMRVPRARAPNRIRRPGLVALLQQWQVDQPFAGVVDDIEVEAGDAEEAAQGLRGAKLDRYAELAQALGAFGPLRGILPKRFQVLLVVEAGNRVVGLRLEIGALDAALGLRKKEGQPAPRHEIADERGNEHGLARARQPGHAEAERGRHHVG